MAAEAGGGGSDDDEPTAHELKRDFKAIFAEPSAEKRRTGFINRQRQARNLVIERLRAGTDQGAPASPPRKRKAKRRREDDTQQVEKIRPSKYACTESSNLITGAVRTKWKNLSRSIMCYEWMTEVPRDLSENWYIMGKPEGTRCMLFAKYGHTWARSRHGAYVIGKTISALPGGSPKTLHGIEDCMLDCIYSPEMKIFFVLDIPLFAGRFTYDTDLEFRTFWKQSKLTEINVSEVTKHNHIRIIPLSIMRCTRQNLEMAYNLDTWAYPLDGLFFVHKESRYVPGVVSPLCLQWKDAQTSQWFVDNAPPPETVPGGGSPQAKKKEFAQTVTLEVTKDYSLITYDEHVLGTVSEVHKGNTDLIPGINVRYSIDGARIVEKGGQTARELVNPEFTRVAPRIKTAADTWSKIQFQADARAGRSVTIAQLRAILPKPLPEASVDELMGLGCLATGDADDAKAAGMSD